MGLLQIIKASPLFTELYDHEIDAVIRNCNVRILESGEFLFRENDVGEDLYIVLSGELVILKGGLEITSFAKGELLGELVLINDHVRTTSCFSRGHSEILMISNHLVLGTYSKEPRLFSILMMNIARMLAQRLKKTTAQLHDLAEKVDKKAA
jgi:CRP-like cAMP-binding protein